MIHDHLKLLGFNVRDIVTGYEGVVESISFDLYGCILAALRPPITKDTKPGDFPEGRWFDVKRLITLSTNPVMALPDFNRPEIGAADKPSFPSPPRS